MTASVVPGLSFGPDEHSLPPAGKLLLITDHLASPAHFVLHRALALQLKHPDPNTQRPRVILVSLASEYAHWRAIAAKSNVNLGQHLTAGSLVYVDGLSLSAYQSTRLNSAINAKEKGYLRCPPLFGSDGMEPSVKGLYDAIAQQLRDHPEEVISQQMVILDDISLLEFIGVPSIAVIRLIRALRDLCRRHSASLIIRAHTSPSPSSETGTPFDSDTLRALVDACHVHVEVRPLASGRSGAVSGEIAVHLGGLTVLGDDAKAGMGRRTGVQYRLTEGGAVFFQKGMGASVL